MRLFDRPQLVPVFYGGLTPTPNGTSRTRNWFWTRSPGTPQPCWCTLLLPHSSQLVSGAHIFLYADKSSNSFFFFFWQLVILLLVWVMRKRISLMAQLFKESSACLGDLPYLFFQPFVIFAVLLAFFAFWTTVVVSLATAG